VSDIASDVEAIISRMKPWDSPQSYTSTDVPDWEYLRSSAKALVYWFREMRDDLGRARDELAALRKRAEEAEAERDITEKKVAWMESRCAQLKDACDALESNSQEAAEIYELLAMCNIEIPNNRMAEAVSRVLEENAKCCNLDADNAKLRAEVARMRPVVEATLLFDDSKLSAAGLAVTVSAYREGEASAK
jgi:hypothetical protein